VSSNVFFNILVIVLIHFYDRKNQSLLAYAIENNKTEVFKKFATRLNTGSHENIDGIYESIQNADKRAMRNQRLQNPFLFPQTHLLILKSKTKISRNDLNAHNHWTYIEEAYTTIDNTNNYCSLILQVAAECKNVQIFFDFKHDSTYYLDPATSVNSKGVIYGSGTIYIGAMELLNERTKFKVFGVIVHELCHLAVLTGFMNPNFDPFPTGESELKRRFIDRVMAQCRQNIALDPIIANVFISYPVDQQDSEMIVTYPQVLLQHHGDVSKIEQFKRDYNELEEYSHEVVEAELERALKVFRLLNDDNYNIKYQKLTSSMKAKILHSVVCFQGVHTTLHDLIGNDLEIPQALKSEVIRKVLLKNWKIEVGKPIKLDMKYEIIPRNFASKTFEEVKTEIEYSKIFILADHAGSGKTITFKDSAKKLKEFKKKFLGFFY
jgi:hypothetical protein